MSNLVYTSVIKTSFIYVFLVGVFEEKARLLPWLVFFVSSTRSVHFLCTVHLYHMYLVVNFERIQSLEHGIQNHSKAEGSPLPNFSAL